MNYVASDGLNSSLVTTNTSVIEDRFAIRKEKIADINGSTSAFAVQQALYINPGNSVMFPIFSQIAASYEEYRVNHLKFTLETESYTAYGSTTNTTAGVACLATNFDPDDAQFSNLTQMENYYGRVKGPPYATIMTHDVLMAHRKKGKRNANLPLNQYFVYSSGNGSAPSSSTSKFYDVGLFQLACSNMASSGVIGELYVEYSFTMIGPKQATPLGQNLLYAHVVESAAGTSAAATPLGTTGGILRAGSTLPVVCTTTTFTLPVVGTYLVAVDFSGAVAAVATLTPGSAITSAANLEDNANNGGRFTFSSNRCTGLIIYTVASSGTGANNTVTIGGLTSMASGSADVVISQVSSGFTISKDASLDCSLEQRLLQLEQLVAAQKDAAFAMARRLQIEEDSEEKEEYVLTKDGLVSHQPLVSSSSSSTTQMSQSLLGLVGDYVARKSSSNKKE